MIGCLTGKFAPLHYGHMQLIMSAAMQVNKLYVVLSHDWKFVESLDPSIGRRLTLRNKLLWLKQAVKNYDNIEVVAVDESRVEAYPDGAESWAKLVNDAIGNVKIDKWFSSEPEYTWWVEKYFGAEHVIVDSERSIINVSATEIRSNMHLNFAKIYATARKDFVQRIAIIGTESCGKTTMANELAYDLNCGLIPEYGRFFCENDLCGDESLLEFEDYGKIAMRRYEMEEAEVSKCHYDTVICDTNAFVTQYYCRLYEKTTSKLVDEIINLEDYDLILDLSDEVPWVADGLRQNSNRHKTRELFDLMLDEYLIKYYDCYHKIDGVNYNDRYNKAKKIIQELRSSK